MSLSIYVLQDGRLPGINPGYVLASPITLELFLVPLALGIAWLRFARSRALRAAAPRARNATSASASDGG